MAFSFTLPVIGTVAFQQLALPAVVLGAAIDSVNPCAFGVLIFLMAYLTKVFDRKRTVLLGGLLYTSAVYITYFIAGLGLLSAVQNPAISYWFYWVATFVAFSAAAFEIKDFFWYGKGVSMDMSVIPGSSDRIKLWADKLEQTAQSSPRTALAMTLPIGFGAAAFELPCTGQVYLAILGLISASGVGPATWVPWLALYNLVFVSPLLIITGLMYVGMSSDRLEQWRKKNRRYMRLVAGLFLYGLGAFLLWFTFRQFPTQPTLRPLGFVLFASQVIIVGYVIYRGYLE
ncbi:MAG: hypothetical protein SVU88_00495 [Candidatus Nanohaloarchaea archaeon]|nr:hypothetical protein [Candidatus Nanohaloarchaea archaeon]